MKKTSATQKRYCCKSWLVKVLNKRRFRLKSGKGNATLDEVTSITMSKTDINSNESTIPSALSPRFIVHLLSQTEREGWLCLRAINTYSKGMPKMTAAIFRNFFIWIPPFVKNQHLC